MTTTRAISRKHAGFLHTRGDLCVISLLCVVGYFHLGRECPGFLQTALGFVYVYYRSGLFAVFAREHDRSANFSH